MQQAYSKEKKEQRKNATDLEKEEIQNIPTTKNRKYEKKSETLQSLLVNYSFIVICYLCPR